MHPNARPASSGDIWQLETGFSWINGLAKSFDQFSNVGFERFDKSFPDFISFRQEYVGGHQAAWAVIALDDVTEAG